MSDATPTSQTAAELGDAVMDAHDKAVADHLAELDRIADQLRGVPALYDRRTELYTLLRDMDPPVPYDTISAHTDSGPEAVRVAVLKRRRAAAGNPISRRTATSQT